MNIALRNRGISLANIHGERNREKQMGTPKNISRRIPPLGLRRLLPITLAAVTVVGLATAPVARATDYVFAPGDSFLLDNFYAETITGSFSFGGTTQSLVSITLTDSANPLDPFAGLYTDEFVGDSLGVNTRVDSKSPTTGNVLDLFFEAPGLSANDLPVTGDSAFFGANEGTLVTLSTSSVVDTVDPVLASPPPATVPEPTSLALLGSAIGLFLLIPWANRRGRQSYRDQPEGA
jgi:hypothetical protein